MHREGIIKGNVRKSIVRENQHTITYGLGSVCLKRERKREAANSTIMKIMQLL